MKSHHILLVALLCLSSCATARPQKESFPREFASVSSELTESDAVALAKAAAQRRAIDLSEYQAPKVSRSGDSWNVFFDGKSNALGGHFSVSVDGVSRTTFFSPGR